MDRQLAVQQVIAFLLRGFDSHFENRVALELDRFIAAHANQVVMMVRVGLIEFVVFVPFCQLKLAQNPHPGHELQRAIDGGQTDACTIILQQVVEILSAQMFAFGQILKDLQNYLPLRS